jgi:hypothetical protein
LLEASLGIGFGAGLTSSVFFFLLLLTGAAPPTVVIAFEIVLLLVFGFVFLRTRRHRAQPAPSLPDPPTFSWNWVLCLAFCLGVVLVIVSFFDSASARPFGDWDAWSVWNVRAKFLAADGDAWRNAYSPLLERTHPHYPLLLSSFVARSWKYFGGQTPPEVPIATAFLFLCAVTGLLVSAVAVLRSTSAGLLAGLVLLASSAFLIKGPSQYADVPLSFFILATLAVLLIEAGRAPRGKAVLALAGAFAAFAASSKNEGMLFFGVVLVVFLVVESRSAGWRAVTVRCSAFVLGVLPALLLTLYFKLFLAPANPLFSQSLPNALAKLGDAERYVKIAKVFLAEALLLGNGWMHPFVLLAILAVALRFEIAPERRRSALLTGATLALVLAGYFGGYVVTPLDLEWHIGASLSRLYAHIWPSVVLLSFMVLRRVEDTAMYPHTPSKHKKKERITSA